MTFFKSMMLPSILRGHGMADYRFKIPSSVIQACAPMPAGDSIFA